MLSTRSHYSKFRFFVYQFGAVFRGGAFVVRRSNEHILYSAQHKGPVAKARRADGVRVEAHLGLGQEAAIMLAWAGETFALGPGAQPLQVLNLSPQMHKHPEAIPIAPKRVEAWPMCDKNSH